MQQHALLQLLMLAATSGLLQASLSDLLLEEWKARFKILLLLQELQGMSKMLHWYC